MALTTEAGGIVYRITGDNSQLEKTVKKSEKALGTFGKTAAKLAIPLLAIFGGGAILRGLASFVKRAADFEQLTVAFETMLGSAERAKVILGDLEQFSIVTPFTIDQVNKAGQTLLAFGFEGEKLVGTLKILGDISSATGKDLSEMAVIFGQIRGAGRLMGQDLLQLINAGFNPLQEISERTGRSMRDLKKDMEAGNISFEMVEESFTAATSEGGKFFDLMNKQSKTFSGRLSTLQGNLGLVARSMGERLLPITKELVTTLNDLLTGTTKGEIAARDFENAIKNQAEAQIEVNKALEEGDPSKIAQAQGALIDSIRKTGDAYNKLQTEAKRVSREQKGLGEEEKELKKIREENIAIINKSLETGVQITRLRSRQAASQTALNKVAREGNVTSRQVEEATRKLAKADDDLLAIEAKRNENTQLGNLLSKDRKELIDAEIKTVEKQEASFNNNNKVIAKSIELTKEQIKTIDEVVSALEIASTAIGQIFEIIGVSFDIELDMIVRNREAFLDSQNEKIEKLRETTDAQIAILDEEVEAELAAKGLLEETEIEKLERELAAAKDIGDQELADELAKQLERIRIIDAAEKKKIDILKKSSDQESEINKATAEKEKQLDAEKSELKRKAFEAEKAAKIIDIIITAAAASGRQFADLPLVAAIPAAAVIDGISKASIAIVAAQPIPQFKHGTINIPTDMLANVHQGEIVVPQPFAEDIRQGKATLSAPTATQEATARTGNVTIQIMNESSEVMFERIFEATKNQTLLISEGALVEVD